MRFQNVTLGALFLVAGLVAADTFPAFNTATSDAFPQHPPSVTNPTETGTGAVSVTTGSASTGSTPKVTEAATTTSASSTFAVVSSTKAPSTSSAAPSPSASGNSAMNVRAGAAMILPGFAGFVAGIFL